MLLDLNLNLEDRYLTCVPENFASGLAGDKERDSMTKGFQIQ